MSSSKIKWLQMELHGASMINFFLFYFLYSFASCSCPFVRDIYHWGCDLYTHLIDYSVICILTLMPVHEKLFLIMLNTYTIFSFHFRASAPRTSRVIHSFQVSQQPAYTTSSQGKPHCAGVPVVQTYCTYVVFTLQVGRSRTPVKPLIPCMEYLRVGSFVELVKALKNSRNNSSHYF